MRFFGKKRGVDELLGSSFHLEEPEPEEPKMRDSEYQRLKKSIDVLKDKYNSLSRVEERLEHFTSKHADAVEASLKNQADIEELKVRIKAMTEAQHGTANSATQSVDKLKDIVMGLNEELCSLRKDFYSMTNKDMFNQFKTEVNDEVTRFKSETINIDRRLAEFKRVSSEQAATHWNIEADMERVKAIEMDLKRVFKMLDTLAVAANDLKLSDVELDGKLRKGFSVLKEELTLDEENLNKLVFKNKEFLKIQDQLVDVDRRFRIFEKELKNLGDDDLSMRDFMQKEFRMLRTELGIVRNKVIDTLKQDMEMKAKVERLLPPKLDREISGYRQQVLDSTKAMGAIKVDQDSFKKSLNGFTKDIEMLSRRFAEINILMQGYVKGEEFKAGMDIMGLKLGQVSDYAGSIRELSNQVDALKRQVDSTFQRYDALNKHLVDRMIDTKSSGSDLSRISEELRQLEEAKNKLDALSGSATRIDDPLQNHVFSWIEEQLNKGSSPRQVKQTLVSRKLDPGLVDKFFASQ